MSLFNRLRGREKAGGADPLAALLAVYPPNPPCHFGDMQKLSDAERDENLAQLLEEREVRPGVVTGWLAKDGVDATPMLDPAVDRAEAAALVNRWLDELVPHRTMTPLGDPQVNADFAAFYASDYSGPDIHYSLVADLALLEGEAMRRRDERFDWGVNRLRLLRTLSSYNRITLIKPGDRQWYPVAIDMVGTILGIWHRKAAPSWNTSGRYFGEQLAITVRRGFDPI